MLDPKMERIRAVPMFAEASEDTLAMLAGAADEVTVAPGTALISQGHLSHETYVIEQGEVQILVDDEAVATAGAGEIIGDLAFLDPGPATATVRATTTTRLLVIAHNRMDAVVEREPTMLRTMAAELAERLRAMDARHREDTRQLVSLSIEAVRTVQPPLLYHRPTTA